MQKVIAIDGPSGVGKSTVSRQLAVEIGWTYLDTGAMYRAVTLAWCRAGQEQAYLTNEPWLNSLDLDFVRGKMMLKGEWVHEAIRTSEVTRLVSRVASVPQVRLTLTALQRRIAQRRQCILDGRDIGTVVFPQAFLKVFLMADPRVRATRRWHQLGGEQSEMSLEEILEDQISRDKQDRERETAPLIQAQDAWVVHTDEMTQDQVVAHLLAEVHRRLPFIAE